MRRNVGDRKRPLKDAVEFGLVLLGFGDGDGGVEEDGVDAGMNGVEEIGRDRGGGLAGLEGEVA